MKHTKTIQTIIAYIRSLGHDKRRRQRFISIICALSFLVAGGVFWNLRIIGITLSPGAVSDPNADVETRAEWEATVPKAEALTGRWGADLVSVALSQLGYKESEKNFVVDDKTGEKRGWTRYGAWAEDIYAPWSSLFVSFCVNYANIPAEAFPESPFAKRDPNTLLSALEASPCYMTPKYIPSPGDLIFLDRDGDGIADSMGVVTEFDGEREADSAPVVGDPVPAEPEPTPDPGVIRILSRGGLKAASAPEQPAPVEDDPAPVEEAPATEPAPTEEAPATEQPAPADEAPATEPAPAEEAPVTEPATEQPTPETPARGVHAIEGDNENAVAETVYAPSDSAILGYLDIDAARGAYDGTPSRGMQTAPVTIQAIATAGEAITGVSEITISLDPKGEQQDFTIALYDDTQSKYVDRFGNPLGDASGYGFDATNKSYTYQNLNPTHTYYTRYNALDPHYVINISEFPGMGAGTGGGTTESWEPAQSFTYGGIYALVFQDDYKYRAISDTTNHIGLNWPEVNFGVNSPVTVPALGQWEVMGTISGDPTRAFLRNVSTGYYMALGSSEGYSLFTTTATEPSTNPISYPYLIKWARLTNYDAQSNPFGGFVKVSEAGDDSYTYMGLLSNDQISGNPLDFWGLSNSTNALQVGLFKKNELNTMEVVFNVDTVQVRQANDANLEHNKRIDFLGELETPDNPSAGFKDNNPDTDITGYENYRLYLDVVSKTEPMDVILVIDVSNSMGSVGLTVKTDNSVELSDTPLGNEGFDIEVPSDYKTYDNQDPAYSSTTGKYYITRLQAVMDFLNTYSQAAGGKKGFIENFLSSNDANKLAIVKFSSDENQEFAQHKSSDYHYDSTDVLGGWRQSCDNVALQTPAERFSSGAEATRSAGATCYNAGLIHAHELLKDTAVRDNGHRKLIVFLSDGAPTAAISGTSLEDITDDRAEATSADPTAAHAPTNKVIDQFIAAHDGDQASETEARIVSVAFHGTAGSFNPNFLSRMAKGTGGKFYEAENAEELTEAINRSITPSGTSAAEGVTVTDTLSGFVELNDTVDWKITRTVGAGDPVPLYSGATLDSGSFLGDGATVFANPPISVNGKDITLKFRSDYVFSPDETFTLSYNIKLTAEGKNTRYASVGDGGTDYQGDGTEAYPANATSGNRPGHVANKDATAFYALGGRQYLEHYYTPVVQFVAAGEQPPPQTEVGTFENNKRIDWLGDGVNNPDSNHNNDANYYRLYLDWSGAFTKPYDLLLVIDTSSSMLRDPNGDTGTGIVSRAAIVESALNGENGLVDKFLAANPQNRVAVVKFNGVNENEIQSPWDTVSGINGEGIYEFQVNSGNYTNYYFGGTEKLVSTATGYAWDMGLALYNAANVNDNSRECYWLLQEPHEAGHEGYYTIANAGYGYELSHAGNDIPYYVKIDAYGHLVSDDGYELGYSDKVDFFSTSGGGYTALSVNVARRHYGYSYSNDSEYYREWSNTPTTTTPIDLDIQNHRATNYGAGLLMADDVLNRSSSENQIVLFITDGVPTYWVFDDHNYRGGNAHENSDDHGGSVYTNDGLNVDSANWFVVNNLAPEFHRNHPNAIVNCVMFNNTDFDRRAIDAIGYDPEHPNDPVAAFHAHNASELANILNEMLYPSHAVIQDTLSQYVSLADSSASGIKVTMKKDDAPGSTTTNPVITLWQNGARTADGNGVVKNVVYTPASGDDTATSTGSIAVTFDEDYVIQPDYTYTVSFDVVLTNEAVTMTPESGYPNTGDSGTDYLGTGNNSSSGQPGYFANREASVTMHIGNANNEQAYPKPVVQGRDAIEPPETPVPTYPHSKQIDFLGEKNADNNYVVNNPDTNLVGKDFYRLYLTMTGKRATATDLMILVDRSYSMEDRVSTGSSTTKIDVVNEVLFGTAGASYQDGLIYEFLNATDGNQVCIGTFGGKVRIDGTAGYDWGQDAVVLTGYDWITETDYGTASHEIVIPGHGEDPVQNNEGTNYCAGLELAKTQWNPSNDSTIATNGHNKMMIFLSDGVPTYWLVSTTERGGLGTEDSAPDAKTKSKAYFDAFLTSDNIRDKGIHVEALAFTSYNEPFNTEVLDYFVSTANGDTSSALRAAGKAELLAALNSQIYPSSVIIEDVLSPNVQYCGANGAPADLLVTMEDTTTHTVTNLYKDGAFTLDGDRILRRITVTAPDPTSTPPNGGIVRVEFEPEFVLDPDYTYTVSFNVALTQAAYSHVNQQNDIGQDGTDYGDNATSARKHGLYSNNDASNVTYGVGGHAISHEQYARPVVQVQGSAPAQPQTTTHHVKKVWADSDNAQQLRPASLVVNLYQQYTDGSGTHTNLYASVTLNGSETPAWEYTWTGLPAAVTVGGNTYNASYYAEEETVPDNYTAAYEAETGSGSGTNSLPGTSDAVAPGGCILDERSDSYAPAPKTDAGSNSYAPAPKTDAGSDSYAPETNSRGGGTVQPCAAYHYEKVPFPQAPQIYYKAVTTPTVGKKYLIAFTGRSDTYIITDQNDSNSGNMWPWTAKVNNTAATVSGVTGARTITLADTAHAATLEECLFTAGADSTKWTFKTADNRYLNYYYEAATSYTDAVVKPRISTATVNCSWNLVNGNLDIAGYYLAVSNDNTYITRTNQNDSSLAAVFTFYEQVVVADEVFEAGEDYLLTCTDGGTTYVMTTSYAGTDNYANRLPAFTPVTVSGSANDYTITLNGTAYGNDVSAFHFAASGSDADGWAFNNAAVNYLVYDSQGFPSFSAAADYNRWSYDSNGYLRNKNWTGDEFYYLYFKSIAGEDGSGNPQNTGPCINATRVDSASSFTFYKKVTAPTPTTGSLTISVTNGGTDPVTAGSITFTVTPTDSTGGTAQTCVVNLTNGAGSQMLSDLPFGTYNITYTAPNGHTVELGAGSPNNPVTIGASAPEVNVNFVIKATPAPVPAGGTIVTNTLALQTLTLEKRVGGASGTLLAGANFSLYKATVDEWGWTPVGLTFTGDVPNFADCTPLMSVTTASAGLIDFSGLPVGNYLLYETAAPAGYFCEGGRTWGGPWRVTVTSDGASVTKADGSPLPTNSETHNPVIANVSGEELPSVGGVGVLPYTLCGLLLMAAPLMYLVYSLRRKRKGGKI